MIRLLGHSASGLSVCVLIAEAALRALSDPLWHRPACDG